MSFASWLRQQQRREDPVGDLARDVQADRLHTRAFRHYQQLYAYLLPIGSRGAMQALDRAYQEYQRTVEHPQHGARPL